MLASIIRARPSTSIGSSSTGMDPRRDGERLVGARVSEQDAELVAAEPAEQVLLAQRLAQARTDLRAATGRRRYGRASR